MKFVTSAAGCRAWAEIDLSAVKENFAAARRLLPTAEKLLAVIKANGYGHGALPAAKALLSLPEGTRPDFFAVATAEEGLDLRDGGIETPILVLGHILPELYEAAVRAELRLPVDSVEEAAAIGKTALKTGKKALLHVAVDSGMTRIGFPAEPSSAEPIEAITRLPGVFVEGIFTHLATADATDKSRAEAQSERFFALTDLLRSRGVEIPIRHIQNSASIASMTPRGDMARLGISLYGLVPSDEVPAKNVGLRPAMALRARITRLRTVPAGVPVSYGGTFVTEGDTVVATVSAGYADGVPRAISGKGEVLLGGRRVPILGRVCMDQFMIDATEVPGAKVGDAVTIFGRDGDCEITADEVASLAGTIGYEVVCGITERVPRVLK
ncbi:MAG: alanine racemase [Clostridia bacterium]|nr:alanine racemase [Clostridia bacterium]